MYNIPGQVAQAQADNANESSSSDIGQTLHKLCDMSNKAVEYSGRFCRAAVRMQSMCKKWKSNQDNLDRLIGEHLKKCSTPQVKDDQIEQIPVERESCARQEQNKEVTPQLQRRSYSEPPPIESAENLKVSAEQATKESEQFAKSRAVSVSREPKRVRYCRKCGVPIRRSGFGLTNKQMTQLISDLLAKDEKDHGCVHCFCDTCLGVQTNRRLTCRRNRPGVASSESTTATCDTICDANMKIVLRHLQRADKARKARLQRLDGAGGNVPFRCTAVKSVKKKLAHTKLLDKKSLESARDLCDDKSSRSQKSQKSIKSQKSRKWQKSQKSQRKSARSNREKSTRDKNNSKSQGKRAQSHGQKSTRAQNIDQMSLPERSTSSERPSGRVNEKKSRDKKLQSRQSRSSKKAHKSKSASLKSARSTR